jgi:hypothetical protein
MKEHIEISGNATPFSREAKHATCRQSGGDFTLRDPDSGDLIVRLSARAEDSPDAPLSAASCGGSLRLRREDVKLLGMFIDDILFACAAIDAERAQAPAPVEAAEEKIVRTEVDHVAKILESNFFRKRKSPKRAEVELYRAFIDGAKFAQQWIDFSEAQPPLGCEVLLNTDKGVAIGWRVSEYKFNGVSMHGSIGLVTRWRYIPLIPPM